MTRGGPRLIVLLALLVAACGGVATEPVAPDHLASDRIAVDIDGQHWILLRASDDGMRGLDDFAGADGMLFDIGGEMHPSAVSFVMDGVTIPMDIAWFDVTGALVGVAEMEPCPAEPCRRYAAPAPFRWAVEAPPGAFDGLVIGSRLTVRSGLTEPRSGADDPPIARTRGVGHPPLAAHSRRDQLTR